MGIIESIDPLGDLSLDESQRAGGWCKPVVLTNAFHPDHPEKVVCFRRGSDAVRKPEAPLPHHKTQSLSECRWHHGRPSSCKG